MLEGLTYATATISCGLLMIIMVGEAQGKIAPRLHGIILALLIRGDLLHDLEGILVQRAIAAIDHHLAARLDSKAQSSVAKKSLLYPSALCTYRYAKYTFACSSSGRSLSACS
jgi:hypothetical protein